MRVLVFFTRSFHPAHAGLPRYAATQLAPEAEGHLNLRLKNGALSIADAPDGSIPDAVGIRPVRASRQLEEAPHVRLLFALSSHRQRTAQGVTEADVAADMKIVAAHFSKIRTYGVDGGNQWNVEKARANGILQMAVGVWVYPGNADRERTARSTWRSIRSPAR